MPQPLRVEAVGMSGGIWVLWKDSLKISVTRTNSQFVLLDVVSDNNVKWSLAIVYGSPTKSLRRQLWSDLGREGSNIITPWLAMGDFNSVMNREEVSCPAAFNEQRSKDFMDWINKEGLIDLGFNGSKFTWNRGNSVDTYRAARLDRCLCSEDWLDMHHSAMVNHLPRTTSDHNPILLDLMGKVKTTASRFFQFQATWASHEDFVNVVKRA